MKLHFDADERVSESELLRYNDFVKKLRAGVPVQYVTGYAWFMDLKIGVNTSVLIPRPETEELVNDLITIELPGSTVIVDACTGSGCIALAAKHYLPAAKVWAFDLSEEALKTARENAQNLDLEVEFFQADILQPISGLEADVLISNPPYIPDSERATIENRVKEHEPEMALFCGDDPMTFYAALLERAKEILKSGGYLLAECHRDFAGKVAEMYAPYFTELSVNNDLSGNPRWVKGKKI